MGKDAMAVLPFICFGYSIPQKKAFGKPPAVSVPATFGQSAKNSSAAKNPRDKQLLIFPYIEDDGELRHSGCSSDRGTHELIHTHHGGGVTISEVLLWHRKGFCWVVLDNPVRL